MKTLGVSISRNQLFATLREQSLLSSRWVYSCAVPCREPFAGPEDAARLAEEVRNGTRENGLPPVVLSLPPSWTYLRQVELPVQDLERAKKIHVAELEGNLPVEDEEILSDLLPSPPGSAGRFLAIAARRSAVEKSVAAFTAAGFPLDRVITDHVSLLSAVLSQKELPEGLLLSTLSDIVVLRLEGGAVRWARQFPADLASEPDGFANEWKEILRTDPASGHMLPVTLVGGIPAGLSAELAGAVRFTGIPGGSDGDGSLLAYGAALAPSLTAELGGFSLRTSAETEWERDRQRRSIRIVAVAAAVAVLSAIGGLEAARWAEGKKVGLVRAQIRKEFSEAVPGAKAGPQETAQIREKIQSLQRQQKELGTDFPPLSDLLMKISRALPAKETIAVREVSFDAGRLRLTGEAGGAPIVESYRSALSAALGPDTAVTVQEALGSARAGSVRFTILVEKGASGRAS